MSDKPIIFSAPMVRALLDGRKTQTRRVLRPWPGRQAKWLSMDLLHSVPTCYTCEVNGRYGVQLQHPLAGTTQPYGKVDELSPLTWVRLPYAPGDRLWVREAWASDGGIGVRYYATDDVHELRRKRSPIHMPRWASRLTLTVTEVRVQRLQDISEADAVAEGMIWSEPTDEDREWAKAYAEENGGDGDIRGVWLAPGTRQGYGMNKEQREQMQWGPTAAFAFRCTWNSIHGPDAWDANPWCAAISFTVHSGNIDSAP